jgi:hypothetical protein
MPHRVAPLAVNARKSDSGFGSPRRCRGRRPLAVPIASRQRGGLPAEALLLVACPVSPVWFWWQHQSSVAGVAGAIINAAMFVGVSAVWRPALLRGAVGCSCR